MVDPDKTIRERLDDSRFLAMNLEYAAALSSIESILKDSPDNLEALRLKGNVLEQKALDENESRPRKLAMSREHLAAQACYEKILRIDPSNTVALIDLGDHYKYVDALHRACKYYWDAIELLEKGEARIGMESEIRELLSSCDDLAQHPSTREQARRLADRCHVLLTARGSNAGEGAK